MRRIFILLFCTIVFYFIETNKSYSQEVKYERILNCEDTTSRLGIIKSVFEKEKPGQQLILVAKLGNKERDLFLSERRLYAIKSYLVLSGINPARIIAAFGEKSKGLGFVDIYIGGTQAEIIFSEYNKTIKLGYCESDVRDEKLFQLPINKKSQMKKKYGIL